MKKGWEKIGEVGVDSGLVWLGDPCYCVTQDADEHPAKTWKEFCDKVHDDRESWQFYYRLGHSGLGVCVHTAEGDGMYPVYAKKNSEGRITSVLIEFN